MLKKTFAFFVVMALLVTCIPGVLADDTLPITVIEELYVTNPLSLNTATATTTGQVQPQVYLFPNTSNDFRETYIDSEDYALTTCVRMTLDKDLQTDTGAYGEIAYGCKGTGRGIFYSLVRCVSVGDDKFDVVINKNYNIASSASPYGFETVYTGLAENEYVNVKIISVRNTIHYYLKKSLSDAYEYFGSTTGYWASNNATDATATSIRLAAVNTSTTTKSCVRFKSLSSKLGIISDLDNGVRHYIFNPDEFNNRQALNNFTSSSGTLSDGNYAFDISAGGGAKAVTTGDMTKAIKGAATDTLSGKCIILNARMALNSGSGYDDIYMVDGNNSDTTIEQLVRLESNETHNGYNILANASSSANSAPNTVIATNIPYGEYTAVTLMFGGTNGDNVKYYVNGELSYFDLGEMDAGGNSVMSSSIQYDTPVKLGWKFKFKGTANEGSVFNSTIDYMDAYVSDNTVPVKLNLTACTTSVAPDGEVDITFSNQVGSEARGSIFINGLPVEPHRIMVSGNMNIISIAPPLGGYDPGVKYTLAFANASRNNVLKDICNTALAAGLLADFTVTGNKKDYMAYLAGITGVDDTTITSISPTIIVRNMTGESKKYILIVASYDADGDMHGIHSFQICDVPANTDDTAITPFNVVPPEGAALIRFFIWDNDKIYPILKSSFDITIK